MGSKFAVVGATGAVGREILSVLAEGGVEVADVMALASDRSVGQEVSFGEDDILAIKDLEKVDFSTLGVVILCTDATMAKTLAPRIARAGCWVVDTSDAFSLDADVPLIVPEINREDVDRSATRRIVASPAAAVIQMLHAVAPIHDRYGIAHLTVTSLHSTSFAGRPAMDELFTQTRGIYVNTPPSESREFFSKQIAFNVIPEVGGIAKGGFAAEETRIITETAKVLEADDLVIRANCAWVPTFVGIGQFVTLETDRPVDGDAVRDLLRDNDMVALVDHRLEEALPTMAEVAGEEQVFVSRLRLDEKSVSLWTVADNVRLSATNAVQIANLLVADQE